MELLTEAERDLPEGLEEDAALAIVVQRVFSIAELQTHDRRSLQVWLVDWLQNNEGTGQLWQLHPEKYKSLSDFLKGVGNETDGTNLSPSQISYLTSIAEVISPWCKQHDINVREYVTGRSWSRFREAIPALKRTIREDVDEAQKETAVGQILEDVDNLPRISIREKYRLTSRSDKPYIGDTREIEGNKVVVCLVVDKDLWETERGKFSVFTEWKNITLKTPDKVFVPLPLMES